MTAWLGIAAILLVTAAIFLAYVELNGTEELDLVLAEAPPISAAAPLAASLRSEDTREAAVASSRWATVFSQ